MFRYLLKHFFRNDNHRLLGRWSPIKKQELLYKRVDLANNDHCGSCHYKDIPKIKNDNNNNNDIK